jgi:hypothetical protein
MPEIGSRDVVGEISYQERAMHFFGLLDERRILPENVQEKVFRLSRSKLQKLALALAEAVPIDHRQAQSPFDFVANSPLSGAPTPCLDPDCRIRHVDDLSRFAALYADRTLVRNPFETYVHGFSEDDFDLRYQIQGDIAVALKLRPLIEKGLVGFAGSRIHYCCDCQDRMEKEGHLPRRTIQEARELLTELLLEQLEFEIEIDDAGPIVRTSGQPLDHALAGSVDISALKSGVDIKNGPIPKDHPAARYIAESIAIDVVDDIGEKNFCSIEYGSRYLTDREFDTVAMSLVSSSEERGLAAELRSTFSHFLPVPTTRDLSALVKLREEEGEAFRVYRDALNKALAEASKNRGRLSELYNEVVAPELNLVDKAVHNSRKLAIRDAIQTIGIATGLIAIGVGAGLLPPNIVQILGAAGGGKAVHSIVQGIAAGVSGGKIARDNKYYFLWRFRKQRPPNSSR